MPTFSGRQAPQAEAAPAAAAFSQRSPEGSPDAAQQPPVASDGQASAAAGAEQTSGVAEPEKQRTRAPGEAQQPAALAGTEQQEEPGAALHPEPQRLLSVASGGLLVVAAPAADFASGEPVPAVKITQGKEPFPSPAPCCWSAAQGAGLCAGAAPGRPNIARLSSKRSVSFKDGLVSPGKAAHRHTPSAFARESVASQPESTGAAAVARQGALHAGWHEQADAGQLLRRCSEQSLEVCLAARRQHRADEAHVHSRPGQADGAAGEPGAQLPEDDGFQEGQPREVCVAFGRLCQGRQSGRCS